MTYEDYLQSIYYNPEHLGSLGGVEKLYRAVRKEGKFVLAKVKRWLEKRDSFTLHRQINRKFKRRRVIVPFIDYQWGADVAFMKSYVDSNDGYRFFLLVVDSFSRFSFL